ncbi:probable G-protein coupled receptor 146 [Sorex fumeus]|uniref:probable G-protein coupled receptor 146 n=1 Tax=Sorex fumeus TaxID=62283 RepID=UPI0024AD549B|nr:probable G-protein coupled receptor 146 [Sorex fumeus]XP_055984541.1 probable G-protein coupled receptor 146 [Sorex fumeus]
MWSCGPLNSTGRAEDLACQHLPLALSVLSLLYLVVGCPLGLGYNALLLLANLSDTHAMAMPDVYFTNLAAAGLVLSALAPVQLLGSAAAGWARWGLSREAHVTLLLLFHVCALVSTYSTALLSLDCCIERALPRTYMASAYNTRHVCGFVWGGALLTSFSSLLLYVCSHVAARVAECTRLQDTAAADAILVVVGYLVPALAVLYALALSVRLRKEDTPLDREATRLDPSVHRLVVATVCAQFGLWTPYYLSLLGHSLLASRDKPAENQGLGLLVLAKDAARCLAFASSSITPLLYRSLSSQFPSKLQRLGRRLRCGHWHCPSDPAGGQQAAP